MTFHPDLRLARFFPQLTFGPRLRQLVVRWSRRGRIPVVPDLHIEDIDVPGVSLRLYRPKHLSTAAPALLWMHGGGFIIGQPEQDETNNIVLARELGITVAAVRYRLAPDHPAPAAVEDAYAALRWLQKAAHVDSTRIAIGGASAGGGLAATLAQLAIDRGEVPIAFQLLIYPMLDDRTVTRVDLDTRHARIWGAGSNAWAWSAYLGKPAGSPEVPSYAAAARRTDLSGLPPAWIGVGTLDIFHDEDLAYAQRLKDCGVPCELHVIPGAFHGFDAIFRWAAITRTFKEEQLRALRAALSIDVIRAT